MYSKCVQETPCLPQKGVADDRQVIGVLLHVISWVRPAIKTTGDHQLCPQGTGLTDTMREVCMGHSPTYLWVAYLKLYPQPSPPPTMSGSPSRETFPTVLLAT